MSITLQGNIKEKFEFLSLLYSLGEEVSGNLQEGSLTFYNVNASSLKNVLVILEDVFEVQSFFISNDVATEPKKELTNNKLDDILDRLELISKQASGDEQSAILNNVTDYLESLVSNLRKNFQKPSDR